MVKVGVLIGAIICIIGAILELINFVSLEIQTLTYETLAYWLCHCSVQHNQFHGMGGYISLCRNGACVIHEYWN